MTTPLPERSVPRIDAVNDSSGMSARSITTASSAGLRSNARSAALGWSSAGNDHCVDSGIVGNVCDVDSDRAALADVTPFALRREYAGLRLPLLADHHANGSKSLTPVA